MFRNILFKSGRLIKHQRVLHTDGIYPYPDYYYSSQIIHSHFMYREAHEKPAWALMEDKRAKKFMILFWTWIFYGLFDDPGALFGHCHFPDPAEWTDEELGIPPLEMGSYRNWLQKKLPNDS